MTSLIGWVGVDSRGPASIYLASDSRISWSANATWDHGRKLFASERYPGILGYVGDVLFPSQILGRVVDLIDRDLLFEPGDTPDRKWARIVNLVKSSFVRYPPTQKEPFSVIFATREGSGMSAVFSLAKANWLPSSGWSEGWIELPATSGLIDALGSGTRSVREWYSRWSRTDQHGTSRSVFSAFCDSLYSGEDERSGGAPQLVGIYRVGPAKTFGVVYKSGRFVLGLPADTMGNLSNVEWRNSLFERCDPATLEPLPEAQRQPAPRGLGREHGDSGKQQGAS
jgi:hypothetical protein